MEKEKILVVDDERAIVENITEFLEIDGYQIYRAYNARQAWEILIDKKINLVITDYQMPGMSGLELSQRILAYDRTMPIIVLSGNVGQDLEMKFLRVGVRFVYQKPFSLSKLKLMIELCLLNPST